MLVGLPVIFAILFVSILIPLLFDLNKAVAEERASRVAIAEVYKVFIDIFKSTFIYANWVVNKDELEMQRFAQSLIQLKNMSTTLRKLEDQDPELSSRRRLLADSLDKSCKFGFDLVESQKSGSLSKMESLLAHQRFYSISEPAAVQLDRLLAIKYKELRKLKETMEQKLIVILITLALGTVLNILLTIILFRLFIYGLTGRIKILSENAMRLPAALPLLEFQSGTDELSLVEDAFTRMARDTERIAAAKQDYLAAISHDFRTPLASLIATMSATARGLYGTLSPAGIAVAHGEGVKLGTLTRTVNDLLALERLEASKLEVVSSACEIGDILLLVEEKVHEQYAHQHDLLEKLNFQNLAAPIKVASDTDKFMLVMQRLIDAALIDSGPGEVVVAAKIDGQYGSASLAYQTIEPRASRKYLFERNNAKSNGDDEELQPLRISLALSKLLVEELGGELVVLCDQQHHQFLVRQKLWRAQGGQ